MPNYAEKVQYKIEQWLPKPLAYTSPAQTYNALRSIYENRHHYPWYINQSPQTQQEFIDVIKNLQETIMQVSFILKKGEKILEEEHNAQSSSKTTSQRFNNASLQDGSYRAILLEIFSGKDYKHFLSRQGRKSRSLSNQSEGIPSFSDILEYVYALSNQAAHKRKEWDARYGSGCANNLNNILAITMQTAYSLAMTL